MVQESEKEGQNWRSSVSYPTNFGFENEDIGAKYSHFGLPGRFLIPGDIRTQLRPEPPEGSAVFYLYPDPRCHSQVGFPFL